MTREEIADRILRVIEMVDALDYTKFCDVEKALDGIAKSLNALERDVRPPADLSQFEGV